MEGPIEERRNRVMLWMLIWKTRLRPWLNRDVALIVARYIHKELVILKEIFFMGQIMVRSVSMGALASLVCLNSR